MEKISVIIPTYKRGKFLKRALNSVLKQTYKNIEVIVIDDNIIDSNFRLETEKIMKKYKKDSRVVYFKNSKNIGGALSRNKGIEFATGEFIAFLDDDDEYVVDKLQKQLDFYKEKFNKKDGFIFCQAKFIDDNGIEIPKIKKKICGNEEALFEVLKGGITSTGCIFLPKKLLLEVNGFEKLICGQEWYLILKILLKNYDCYSMDENLLIYYDHDQERITNSLKKIEGEKILYEIKKRYIQDLSKDKQKYLHYSNNLYLANLHLQFKEKGSLFYIKESLKYKMLSMEDILKLILNIFLSQKNKIFLKRILMK